MEKDKVYAFAKSVRVLLGQVCNQGTSGDDGGVDGEMSSPVMWNALNAISAEIVAEDPHAFGFDVGHGSGVAAMAYFNEPLSLPMMGAEFNYQRCFCSWRLQEEMLLHDRDDFQKVAAMSRFIFGSALNVMIEKFGPMGKWRSLHLKLVYWFRQGWSQFDIVKLIEYMCDKFPKLEWIICDMSADKLVNYGFNGEILSSVSYSGSMNKSASSRTVYVHKVHMQFDAKTKWLISQKEKLVIDSFSSESRLFERLSEVQWNQKRFWETRSGTRSGLAIGRSDHDVVAKQKRRIDATAGSIASSGMNDKRARSEQSAESDSLVVLPVVSHKKRGPSKKMSFKNFMLYLTEQAMTRVQEYLLTEHPSIDENGIIIDEW